MFSTNPSFKRALDRIKSKYGYLKPSMLFDEIVKDYSISHYTYVILGKPGPTGKTWLWTKLIDNDFRAVELTPGIYNLVEYTDDDNHCIVDDLHSTVIIVLNRPLK